MKILDVRATSQGQATMPLSAELTAKCTLWKVQCNRGDDVAAEETLSRIHQLQLIVHGGRRMAPR